LFIIKNALGTAGIARVLEIPRIKGMVIILRMIKITFAATGIADVIHDVLLEDMQFSWKGQFRHLPR
jgi:hypothetical protein